MIPASADTADQLLRDLAAEPENEPLRERAARALADEGRPAESVAVLKDGLIHLNAHEPGDLPCLCARCIDPDTTSASAGATAYRRDFVTALGGPPRGRVLFYWIPETLYPDRRRVRRSVQGRLRDRFPG